MVVADDERRYVAVNPAACLLLRMSEADALRLRVDDLTPPEARATMDELWAVFLRDGTQRGTFELQMPDGPRLAVEYSATANVAPGRHLAILMFPTGGDGEAAPARHSTPELLTDRERQVLNLVAMGMGSTSIASALSVSTHTVETHVRHCLAKLGARNRAHAIALGVRTGDIRLDLGQLLPAR
jgi:DNA-binding CsgD family transcriptional regulator